MVKNTPASAGDAGSIPESGRSLEKKMATNPSVLAGKPHGQRSLVGYSPWGHRRARHDLVTKQQRQDGHSGSDPYLDYELLQESDEVSRLIH